MNTRSYTIRRSNYRLYGKDGFATYTLFTDGMDIGHIDEYCKVVNKIVNRLNKGEMKLSESGFKANNGEFFHICGSCGDIHLDGTRNNCV